MFSFLLLIHSVLAQEVSLHVEQEKMFVDVPFVLTVMAKDFAEDPTPDVADLKIEGCDVEFLGVNPSVSRQVSIINGRRSEMVDIRYAYQYRIVASKSGRYQIPAVEVTQGASVARSSSVSFMVEEVPSTRDLAVHLELPQDSFWVGQEMPVFVDLYLRKDISDLNLSVPLFDQIPVKSPSENGQGIEIVTAFGSVVLPTMKEKVTWKGQEYTRIRMGGELSFTKAGQYTVEPTKVVANVAMRQTRGAFGFPQTQYKMFQASDTVQQLEVKPLPLTDQPDSFSGAVGSDFSIEVSASRTVVSVGEPISIEIRLRGKGQLQGLQLPSLAQLGFDEKIFQLPKTDIIGVEEDSSKLFQFNVQLKTAIAQEIPSLEFSFFNPELGKYQRAYSQPIALSVKEAEKIGVADVFSAQNTQQSPKDTKTEQAAQLSSGTDLSLRSPTQTLKNVITAKMAFILGGIGHLVALFAFAFSFWWAKGKEERVQKGVENQRQKELKAILHLAKTESADQVSRKLCRSLQEYGRETGIDFQEEIASIEVASFAPTAKMTPLSSTILEQIAKKLLILFCVGVSMIPNVSAEEVNIEQWQAEYREALSISQRSQRLETFQSLHKRLAPLLKKYPNSPELWVDYGNTALEASDLGTASFAYEKALLLQPRNERAKHNQEWIESQLPSWAQWQAEKHSLLLWGQWFSVVERTLFATIVFALLLIFVRFRRYSLSLIAGVIWISLALSIFLELTKGQEGFVWRGENILRSADSFGAPALRREEIPQGTHIQIHQEQGKWTQVSFGVNEKGWLPTDNILKVSEE